MLTRKPRKGDLVDVQVEGLDDRGRSTGEVEGVRVRLRAVPPGAKVRGRVLRKRRGVLEVDPLEILDPGPNLAEPRCEHFGSCGGCSLQNLAYAAQLEELGRLLARWLEPLEPHALDGRLEVEPILGCEDPWHYRNKMDFTFGTRRWIEADEPEEAPNGFALGLHVPRRFDKVLDVRDCSIAFPEASSIVATTRRLAVEQGLSAWDVRAHTGLLRHLVLRKSWASGEVMANLVTTEESSDALRPLVEGMLAAHPELSTLVQSVNPGVALVAVGEKEVLWHGSGRIEEVVRGLRFSISAGSFFQTNSTQAVRLLEIVLEQARVQPGDVVHDLYCGAGFFSLALARAGAEVHGFEIVAEAIEDARRNAALNGVEGVRFREGDLALLGEEAVLERAGSLPPRICIVDPPRAGLHKKVVAALGRLAPRRIVYVSCNPKGAIADLVELCALGYRVGPVCPVDLFPHTPHLECVFTLERGTSP